MKKGTKQRTRKKNYNLLLDLDETILQSVKFPTWFYDESSRHLFPLVGISMPLILNQDEIKKHKSAIPQVYQVFFRPYLINFLDYCFKNFDVSIWTNSTQHYCMSILKFLKIDDKCKHIFFRKDKKSTRLSSKNINFQLNKSIPQEFEFGEYRTKKVIKMGVGYRTAYKPMELLWQHSHFGKYFKSSNTFIIDDLSEMFAQYPDNTILMPAWCHLNWSDNYLKITIDKIEQYLSSKKRKNIKNLCQTVNNAYRIQDVWQDIASKDCQDTLYRPEIHYKRSTTKKNQQLLLKKEKVGDIKVYGRRSQRKR